MGIHPVTAAIPSQGAIARDHFSSQHNFGRIQENLGETHAEPEKTSQFIKSLYAFGPLYSRLFQQALNHSLV